jgi:Raf kinase inhibitor-like YbhB/YbcL family protein
MSTKWLGRILRPFRAGEKQLASNAPGLADAPAVLRLTSPTFVDGGGLPIRCAGPGVGANVSPALSWSGVPEGARELVLIVEDPSAPLPRPFLHAVISIPPDWTHLDEGAMSSEGALRLGRNWARKRGYTGPGPVPGHGAHTYAFQLFAVDRPLTLAPDFGRRDVMAAMGGHVIGRGRIDGTYER